MTAAPVPAQLADGVGLLERAVSYALGNLRSVTPRQMTRPTPCRGWTMRMLVRHLNDSLDVLYDGIDARQVDAAGASRDGCPAADPVALFRSRASRLLGGWTNADGGDGLIAISDCPLSATVVAAAGAMEIAVHGWDISQASGECRPIPAALAAELLEIAPLVVTGADRPVLFGAPVAVPVLSAPGDRLVAFLGRVP